MASSQRFGHTGDHVSGNSQSHMLRVGAFHSQQMSAPEENGSQRRIAGGTEVLKGEVN